MISFLDALCPFAPGVTSTASTLVHVREITRRFDGRTAVERVTFELRAGEVLALLGPNGAGKTTTMRLLAGLLMPDAGRIEVGGTPLTARTPPEVRRRIGLLTEAPGLWDRLSVEANLLTYARLYGLPDPVARVRAALERFELADRAGDQAATLSKGMKQKVALARTLLHDPAVVLLDEPTAGLDPAMAKSVRALVSELRDEGRAVLLSTHNLDEAERVADRVAVLRQRLLALAAPEELRRTLFGAHVRIEVMGEASPWRAAAARVVADPEVEGSQLRCRVTTPEQQTPALVRALVEAGAPIRSVVEERAGLEEIYLALVGEGAGSPDPDPRQATGTA
jgi:ABC-2 type transport system ATP-binding protein